MFELGSWLGPHMMVIYGLLLVAIIAIIASISGFLPRATLPWILGFTLGPAIAMFALRYARKKLLDEIAAIQKERDVIRAELAQVRAKLAAAAAVSQEEQVKLNARAEQLDAAVKLWDQAVAASKKNILMMDARETKDKETEQEYINMSAEEIFDVYTKKHPDNSGP